MRTYEKPLMIIEEFIPNQAIAACTDKAVDFTCFRGPNNDTENVLLSECSRKAGYAQGATTATSSYKRKTWSNVDGLAYICTPHTGGTGGKPKLGDTTSEWQQSGSIITHKKNWNNDTHDKQWHCMVAGITDYSTVSAS